MASETVKMKNNHAAISIGELSRVLKREIDAELVDEISRTFQSAAVVLLTFERFYLRIGSYATLTILLAEEESVQTADIIGSGGGEGVFNISWGANKSLANMAIKIMQKYGFEVEGQ